MNEFADIYRFVAEMELDEDIKNKKWDKDTLTQFIKKLDDLRKLTIPYREILIESWKKQLLLSIDFSEYFKKAMRDILQSIANLEEFLNKGNNTSSETTEDKTMENELPEKIDTEKIVEEQIEELIGDAKTNVDKEHEESKIIKHTDIIEDADCLADYGMERVFEEILVVIWPKLENTFLSNDVSKLVVKAYEDVFNRTISPHTASTYSSAYTKYLKEFNFVEMQKILVDRWWKNSYLKKQGKLPSELPVRSIKKDVITKEDRRPKCPECNVPMVKSGLHGGNQWFKCPECNKRTTDSHVKKSTCEKKTGRPVEWTTEKNDYIIKNYPNTPIEDMAKELNKTKEAIHVQAMRLGVTKRKHGGVGSGHRLFEPEDEVMEITGGKVWRPVLAHLQARLNPPFAVRDIILLIKDFYGKQLERYPTNVTLDTYARRYRDCMLKTKLIVEIEDGNYQFPTEDKQSPDANVISKDAALDVNEQTEEEKPADDNVSARDKEPVENETTKEVIITKQEHPNYLAEYRSRKVYGNILVYVWSRMGNTFFSEDMIDLLIEAYKDVFGRVISPGTAVAYSIAYCNYMNEFKFIKTQKYRRERGRYPVNRYIKCHVALPIELPFKNVEKIVKERDMTVKMGRPVIWTPERDQILIDNRATMTAGELAKKLKTTKGAVRSRISKLYIRKRDVSEKEPIIPIAKHEKVEHKTVEAIVKVAEDKTPESPELPKEKEVTPTKPKSMFKQFQDDIIETAKSHNWIGHNVHIEAIEEFFKDTKTEEQVQMALGVLISKNIVMQFHPTEKDLDKMKDGDAKPKGYIRFPRNLMDTD